MCGKNISPKTARPKMQDSNPTDDLSEAHVNSHSCHYPHIRVHFLHPPSHVDSPKVCSDPHYTQEPPPAVAELLILVLVHRLQVLSYFETILEQTQLFAVLLSKRSSPCRHRHPPACFHRVAIRRQKGGRSCQPFVLLCFFSTCRISQFAGILHFRTTYTPFSIELVYLTSFLSPFQFFAPVA